MYLPLSALCTEKKVRCDGTSIIYIQYCYSSQKRTLLNTEIAIPPKHWNEKKELVSEKLPAEYGEPEKINSEVKRMRRLAEDIIELGQQRNVEDLVSFVKEYFAPETTVETVREKLIAIEKAKLLKETEDLSVYKQLEKYITAKEKSVSPATLCIIKNVGDHLRAFETFRGLPITFDSFDFNFYDTYVDFLTHEYVQPRFKTPVVGLKINTVSKTIKNLKRFIQDRVKRKIILPIDLTDYKAPTEETDAIYLTYEEIAQIYQTDLTLYPKLIPYRDLFVLACLTGLRFSDFSTLRPEDLRNDKLYKKQEKSDQWVVIPLREEAKQIFTEQFKDSIPNIYNSDFNANIKIIGKLAGISQPITFSYKKGGKAISETRAKCDWITSHTGRRSFCTNEFLAGTPSKLIMMISGHKKEKDFYRYIRIKPEEAAEILQRIWMERNAMQPLNSKTVLMKAS